MPMADVTIELKEFQWAAVEDGVQDLQQGWDLADGVDERKGEGALCRGEPASHDPELHLQLLEGQQSHELFLQASASDEVADEQLIAAASAAAADAAAAVAATARKGVLLSRARRSSAMRFVKT